MFSYLHLFVNPARKQSFLDQTRNQISTCDMDGEFTFPMDTFFNHLGFFFYQVLPTVSIIIQ